MLYMQLLMYESGRRAVEHLIEFEPNRNESLINILCSKTKLYELLSQHFDSTDCRFKRLALRRKGMSASPH